MPDGRRCFEPLTAAQILKSNGTSTSGTNMPPPSCSAPSEPGQSDAGQTCGDPVNLTTGNNYRLERDYTGAGAFPLMLTRAYNSLGKSAGSFGANWSHGAAAGRPSR